MFDDVFKSCLSCFICFRHSQYSFFESEFFLLYYTDTQYIFLQYLQINVCMHIHTHITLPMFIFLWNSVVHCLTLVYIKFLFTLHDKNLIHEISTYTCMLYLYLIVTLIIFKLNFKLLNFLPKQFYQFHWVNTIYFLLNKESGWVF